MELRIKSKDGVSRSVALGDGESCLLIGRGEKCDIVLADETMCISRRHACLRTDGSAARLSDVGSALGTFVNGERLSEERSIQVGDEIVIGDYALTLVETQTRGDDVSAVEKLKTAEQFYTPEMMTLKRRIQDYAMNRLDLPSLVLKGTVDDTIKGKLVESIGISLKELQHELPLDIQPDGSVQKAARLEGFRQALLDEVIGLGPLSPILRHESITEIMVNGPEKIYVEEHGVLTETAFRFFDEEHLRYIIQRIVEPLGRRVDESSPMVDARLEDGSRVNAIIPPLALDGSSLTIRKFAQRKLTAEDLIAYDSMTTEMDQLLREAVRSKQNILVSGGTGSGKTTLLNMLSQYIPANERIVTIEDSAELKLSHGNIVRLEARPANIEGKGRVTIHDLVVNALRMRPDRIIVGECRGAEAWDMLQAMNTGHDGSLTTCHANTARDALSRVANMVLMTGLDMPMQAIREQVSSALNLVVQQARLPDGSRKIIQISEILGREGDTIVMSDIFVWKSRGYENHKAVGDFTATGNIPRFIEVLREKGELNIDMSVFVPKG